MARYHHFFFVLKHNEERNDSLLLSPFSLQQNQKKRRWCIVVIFFFSNTKKKAMTVAVVTFFIAIELEKKMATMRYRLFLLKHREAFFAVVTPHKKITKKNENKGGVHLQALALAYHF